jgi:tRNA pseudouridine32 synthase/23S rRNA pseudouridine746 synthase
VLHHDDHLLILSKPSGLLSVPGKGEDLADCLEMRARGQFPTATMVHRLDRDTSGLLVMAVTAKAHRHLGLQFERRKVQKRYVARVWGNVTGEEGHIDLPLICDWPNRPKQMVDHEHGRAAQTGWQVLERETSSDGSPLTRLALFPLTGRSHQLRVHMLELGHAILGDRLYAGSPAFAAADRLQLHAESLTLFHPADGRVMTFEDACPF